VSLRHVQQNACRLGGWQEPVRDKEPVCRAGFQRPVRGSRVYCDDRRAHPATLPLIVGKHALAAPEGACVPHLASRLRPKQLVRSVP
jgi:hypothetical protein